ncbi:P-loop containing nucleoside triphosphate hydrolase protein [Syncephalastrum racemosum]|uniref:Structural maintenance of chromosomes protein 5 n=1 Tax=Syncephalastrum racemosum TaxID=13706 RepID=A0A1X2HAN4_SYNRA|nr:P-loop containing nucleoside triphosphate hydrolase protein [Syncephalastrum racemosum]
MIRYEEQVDAPRRRLNLMRQKSEDTVKAYRWLNENKHRFKGKIYGPIALNLNLKDQRYANMVESILGGTNGAHLKTFVCELKEDYDDFTKEILDTQELRVTVAWPDKITPESTRPMMPETELREKYGMEHFVSELLEGPQVVMGYLCQQARINLIPLSMDVKNEEKIAEHGPFQRYGMKDNIYETKRYQYGRGGHQTSIRPTQKSLYLQDSGKSSSWIIENVTHTILLVNAEEIHAARKALEHAKQEKTIAESKTEDIRKNMREHNARKGELEQLLDELSRMKATPVDEDGEIQRAQEDYANLSVKRARAIIQFRVSQEKYIELVLSRNKAQLEFLQADTEYNIVERYVKEQSKGLEIARVAMQKATLECNHAKTTARSYQQEAKRAGSRLPPDLLEAFKEIYQNWRDHGFNQTHDEIEDEIKGEEAKAEALKATNPHAMENYERRLREINTLSSKIEEDASKLADLQGRMQTIRAQWEPRLESVVSRISEKFSEAMQKIGCAGEVCVSRDEDYDKWGIEIRVKFRDNERLQLLTGQRQSGGERAVSTILYLMALQNLARSPFRVVDEINQGMDPRNERMIHEHIVGAASKVGTAQYFLITPKLLPDLAYNERMQVLCIYSGEWLSSTLRPLTEYVRRAGADTSAHKSKATVAA